MVSVCEKGQELKVTKKDKKVALSGDGKSKYYFLN